ncbi:MAG: response regulator [Planctomycetes bacterium]|nr:response regulator [Planctomycetota bacterium]
MRERRWQDGLAAVAGASSAALGLLVIAGWHLRVPFLVQVRPGWTAMVYNTALGFILCGAALLAARAGKRRLPAALGLAAAAGGALNLYQHTTGLDLGIDNLLIAHSIADATPHAGRMAPNTALCFVLAGAALAVTGLAARARSRLLATALLGSLVASMGLNAFSGYFTGLKIAYAWGPLVPMAVHTAAGFCLLGAGLVALAWREAAPAGGGLPRWFPVLAGVAVATITVGQWQALVAEESAHIGAITERGAAHLRREILSYIGARLKSLARLAGRWRGEDPEARTRWDADAATYVAHDPTYRGIGWVDPQGRLQWIVPLAGHEGLVGRELTAEDRRRRALEESRALGEPRLTPFLDLLTGEPGLIACVPILVEEGFHGWVAAGFPARALLDGIIAENDTLQDYAVRVLEGDTAVYASSRGGAAPRSELARWSEVPLPGATWRVEMSPLPRIVRETRSLVPIVVLAAGLLLAAALALAVHLALSARAAARGLEREFAQRRETEEALRESREHLSRVIETLADALFICDGSGRIVFANAAAEEVLGLERSQITERAYNDPRWRITTPAGELVPDEDLPFARVLRTGQPVRGIEHGVERADGTRVVLSINAAPLLDARGKPAGMVATATDITRRTEVDRLKDELVSTVSHELRTPLTSLQGFAEILLQRSLPPERQREFLTIIHGEAVRLSHLVNDFLDLQRIESGRQTYDFKMVELPALVEEALAPLRQGAKERSLRTELPGGLPRVWADPDRLRQVVTNLVSNAIKFSPGGGEVTIGARKEGDTVVVWVADQGVGIPRDALPRLFTKFYRVEDEATRGVGGTGLGLAIAKEIVEAHHGRIGVESEPGRGSTFSFSLQAPLEPTPLPRAPGEAPPGALDVLVVENDRAISRLLREHFEVEGLRVKAVASGEEGLDAARCTPPRLVLLDVHLAGALDGWDLLAALKSDPALEPVPVFLISSSHDANARGLALAGADCLLKPCSREALCQAVRRQLPPHGGGRVLVADDDPVFLRQAACWLGEEEGLEVVEATSGTEALEEAFRRTPDLLVLDLVMPGPDGFEVLRTLREDGRFANLPVLVVTAKDLLPEEKARLKSRMATLVGKRPASLASLARLAAQMLRDVPAPPPLERTTA